MAQSYSNDVVAGDLMHKTDDNKQNVERPLRRCTSLIPECGMIYPLQNEVVTATSSFTYMDILPPPTHVQFKNKMHKIRFNMEGRRYIVYEGKDILLKDIATIC